MGRRRANDSEPASRDRSGRGFTDPRSRPAADGGADRTRGWRRSPISESSPAAARILVPRRPTRSLWSDPSTSRRSAHRSCGSLPTPGAISAPRQSMSWSESCSNWWQSDASGTRQWPVQTSRTADEVKPRIPCQHEEMTAPPATATGSPDAIGNHPHWQGAERHQSPGQHVGAHHAAAHIVSHAVLNQSVVPTHERRPKHPRHEEHGQGDPQGARERTPTMGRP